MSKRSQWTDISKEERKKILIRDNRQCVYCGNKKTLTMAHIFLSRSQGGKGCSKNIVSLCANCHLYTLDNPIGDKKYEKSKEILKYCKNYLIDKEHITYDDAFLDSLKFKKERVEIQQQVIDYARKQRKTCKDCEMLVKHNNNSSIPFYYCKYRKMRKNKNADICNKFKSVI